MEIKCYDTLPEEAALIRKAVFMEEQGFQKEFDALDSQASHLVVFDNDKPVATCRLFPNQGTDHYTVGRIAVVKQYRGQKIGTKLLRAAEEIVKKNNGTSLFLHAQIRAKEFYEKQGYCPHGEPDWEEDCPHIWMCKKIR